MKIEFKVTMWEEVIISDEHEENILSAIKNGDITCSNDIYDTLDPYDIQFEILPETTEQMDVASNGGASTIEVFSDSGSFMWDNEPKE